ncbi:MAG: O-methyltransferase [Flavobacteriaceae bacterium]|nr:O-methyltransferase [Flavobacteriaceae bacterium]
MESQEDFLFDYATQHSTAVPELLLELERETHQKILQPRMLSGPLQGRFLSLLAQLLQPQCIVEIGTFTGYASLCLAEGLTEDGVLHTLDCNEELVDIQQKYFSKSPYHNKIKSYLGAALELLPRIEGPYDLVFIDADKPNYEHYFEMVLPKTRKGGLIISDNVLWSGKVLQEADPKDESTIALKKYNQKLSTDPRVFTTLLPLRDGLSLSWVR